MNKHTKAFLDGCDKLTCDGIHDAYEAMHEAVAELLHQASGQRRTYLRARREDPHSAGIARQVQTKFPALERELRNLETQMEKVFAIVQHEIPEAVATTRRDLQENPDG